MCPDALTDGDLIEVSYKYYTNDEHENIDVDQVEVQALASTSTFGKPRRTPNGVDFNRLLLVTAVLTRRLNFRLADQDVFVNIVGGLHIQEPAADLAIAGAIASSVKNQPLISDTVLIGEIGLSGELRVSRQMASRLNEAANLGIKLSLIHI